MDNLRFYLLRPLIMCVAYALFFAVLHFVFNRDIEQSVIDSASLIGCLYTFLLAKTAKDFLRNLRVMYKLLHWERCKADILNELKGLQIRITDEDGYDEDSRIHLTMQMQKLEHFKDAFDKKVQNAIEQLNKTLSFDQNCKRYKEVKQALAVIISNIELEQDFEKLFDIISK